jgi:cytochrome P450
MPTPMCCCAPSASTTARLIDVVAAIARPFVYKVLPDLLGLPDEGRENMTAFGHMVWATLGPQNELFHEAMDGAGPVIEWVERCCNRENLDPDGLGMQMFLAADRGEITQAEAKLLVGILLSAAADTTVMTLSTAMRAFSLFPDQYRELAREPGAGPRRLRGELALGLARRGWPAASRCATSRSTTT